MGLFSWMTSDTNDSISVWDNPFADLGCRTFNVYMKDHVGGSFLETQYKGYGVFGGKDYFVLVAEMNTEHPAIDARDMDDEASRDAGLHLAFLPDQDGIIYPTLSRDPDFKWSKDAKPESCPDQGYFYNF